MATDFTVVPLKAEPSGKWVDELLYTETKKGKRLRVVLANVVSIFVHDERWNGVLAFDAFAECVVKTKRPPWHADDAPKASDLGDWTDEDTARAAAWLQRNYEFDAKTSLVDEAIPIVARRTIVHPVRDYLVALEWDGVPRIDTWLVDIAAAKDSPYVRAVGAKFLISCVARVFEPGCKVDSVLVLEGAQGLGKSTALRDLVGEKWFLEFTGDIGGKDALVQLRRRWLGELCELDSLSRAELSRVKAFLTTRTDTFRPPYGRRARDFQRQIVFAGTTNATAYLRDESGGRRFWPIRCGRIDLERLRAYRDQLWAEAVREYRAGRAWHVVDAELANAFVEEQADRFQADPWEAPIADWIGCAGHPERRTEGVTTSDVLEGALKIDVGRWTRADEMRVAAVLRHLGWSVGKQITRSGARVRPYKPELCAVVQEVVQTPRVEKTSSDTASSQHAHPPARTHIGEEDHDQCRRENGWVGREVVQSDDSPHRRAARWHGGVE